MLSSQILKQVGGNLNEDILENLIREYSYTSILYREYRSKAVHEVAGIYIDSKKFWRETRPYFATETYHWFQYPIFVLEFPFRFLIQCLDTCVDCAEKAIIGKGSLPVLIWYAICDYQEIDFLDSESIEEAKPNTLRID